MNERQLAMLDIDAEPARAFHSMLEVLKGRTRCAWRLVDSIEQADVVVTGTHATVTTAQLAGKQRIAIIDDPNAPIQIGTSHVLRHPFRVMQVLTILDDLADEEPRPELRITLDEQAGRWDFAESVRRIRAASSPAAWYSTRTPQGEEIIVTGNLHNFACEAAVFEQVRAGPLRLSALVEAHVQSVPSQYVRSTLFELLWHNALQADTALAPWLKRGGGFHIRRWPDFGSLPSTRQQLQMVAMLAKRSCSRAQLAHAASTAEADRLLNALSVCDLLVHDAAAPAARAPAESPLPGFMRSLLGSLRRSLRLAY
jgi:hypothetical protein